MRESKPQSNCGKQHLYTDEEVLVASWDGTHPSGLLALVGVDGADGSGMLKNSQQHTLPEREKDDWFDCAELPDWFVGTEEVAGGKVEQEQSIEGQTDRDVVDDCNVQVPAVRREVSILVEVECLQNQCDDGHYWLDEAELQSGLFTKAQETNGVLPSSQTTCAPEKAGLDRLSPDLWHDGALPSQVLIAQTEEVIDDKGFIAVSDTVKVDVEVVIAEEHETEERGEGVNGDDEQDTDDPALLVWARVVTKMQVDLVTGD